jgi:nicotinate-nucleotide adenylyltransferase
MGNIGILGGSFDPPHTAHIAMARAALDTVPLDRVLFMPAPNPPHKRRDVMSPYESRKAMVAIAIRDEEGMELSVAEELRDGPSYTNELLRFLRTQSDSGLYLILGADSVADLPNWRNPKSILDLATLVVFPRTGYSSFVPVEGDASIVLFEKPVIDVSSTEIREKCRRGESTAGLITKAVRKFILDNSLYA